VAQGDEVKDVKDQDRTLPGGKPTRDLGMMIYESQIKRVDGSSLSDVAIATSVERMLYDLREEAGEGPYSWDDN